MPNYAVMRIQKYNNKNKVQGVLNHMNRKFAIKSLPNPQNKNNYYCLENRASPIEDFNDFFQSRVREDCRVRKNSVIAFEIVMTFSPEAFNSEEFNIEDFAQTSFDWCCQHFGGAGNICSFVMHNDETTPHLHALIVPVIDRDGKKSLCARELIGGPAGLRDLQTSYAEAVEHLGLTRGVSKKITKKRHTDHKTFNAMQEIEATVEKFFEF